jgi:hypothetical protein
MLIGSVVMEKILAEFWKMIKKRLYAYIKFDSNTDIVVVLS